MNPLGGRSYASSTLDGSLATRSAEEKLALQRLVCGSCEAKIPSRPFCPKCGTPTKLATSQQRILWEMGQWEDSRTKVVPEKPARLTIQPQQAARRARPAVAKRSEMYDTRMVVGSSAMAIEELDLRRPPPSAFTSGGTGAPPRSSPRPPERARPSVPPAARAASRAQVPVARDRTAPPATHASATDTPPATHPPMTDEAVSRNGSAPQADELRRATPARPSPTRRVAPSSPPARRIPVPPRRAATPERAEAAETTTEVPPAAPAPPPEAFKPPATTDGRTLIIKRRQAPIQAEPTPDPFETASVLRELSERSAKVPSRRERRRARKQQHAQAAKARADAERARKEAEKQAKKLAKKSREDAPAAATPIPDPASIEVPDGPPKLGWKERKAIKLLDAIGGVEGEDVVQMHEGRSRLRAATLVVTNYRIAIVGRGARRRMVGWIPLEEIERIKRVWRGAETLHVEGSFERLSFQAAASGALNEVETWLRVAVKEARVPGSSRHSADVIQAWCERTADVWENGANRMRLWIRKHPAATLVGLSSLVPAAYLLSSNL